MPEHHFVGAVMGAIKPCLIMDLISSCTFGNNGCETGLATSKQNGFASGSMLSCIVWRTFQAPWTVWETLAWNRLLGWLHSPQLHWLIELVRVQHMHFGWEVNTSDSSWCRLVLWHVYLDSVVLLWNIPNTGRVVPPGPLRTLWLLVSGCVDIHGSLSDTTFIAAPVSSLNEVLWPFMDILAFQWCS